MSKSVFIACSLFRKFTCQIKLIWNVSADGTSYFFCQYSFHTSMTHGTKVCFSTDITNKKSENHKKSDYLSLA